METLVDPAIQVEEARRQHPTLRGGTLVYGARTLNEVFNDHVPHGDMLGRFVKLFCWEDCPNVGVRHEVGRLIPEAPAGLLPSGTDPDNRKSRLRRLAHNARVPSR
jgi:hypothetical protein